MADAVLVLGRELGGGHAELGDEEDGVVAEAVVAAGGVGDAALEGAFEDDFAGTRRAAICRRWSAGDGGPATDFDRGDEDLQPDKSAKVWFGRRDSGAEWCAC